VLNLEENYMSRIEIFVTSLLVFVAYTPIGFLLAYLAVLTQA